MDDGTPYKVFMYNEDGAKAEVRRFSLTKAIFGKMRILQKKLQDTYPKLKSTKFSVTWKDEDGDEILLTTDDDLQTMLNESTDVVYKLYVRCLGPSDDDEQEDAAAAICSDASAKIDKTCLHVGVLCNVCGAAVVGYRYKCITCDEFDICVRCEHDGKHPEHCVVRVPVPNMPLPLIKASIKKSRKFLKSVASQAHEENKRIRRERVASRKSDVNANQSKFTQPSLSRNWVEIFGKYMEEFTNLAGDFSRQTEKEAESEPVKATTAEAGPSSATERSEPKSVPDDEISNNPWNLPQKDLEKLQHACVYMRDNAVRASMKPLTKAFNKVLEIATTVAEEATSQSPARAFCPIREASVLKNNGENPEIAKPEPEVAKPRHESPQTESSIVTSGQQTPAFDSKAPAQTDEDIKAQTKSPNEISKAVYVNRCDISELVSAVAAARFEMSSNASSCSSESQGSDRAEGWTVIDDQITKVPDSANSDFSPKGHDLPEIDQERAHYRAPYSAIYPALHSATAVLDLNEGIAAAASTTTAASAPPMTDAPKTQPKATSSKAAKAAKAAAEHQALRNNLAPHVEAAVRQMEAMGFCNASGWLTQLLDHNDGNIATVLDLITPVNPKAKK